MSRSTRSIAAFAAVAGSAVAAAPASAVIVEYPRNPSATPIARAMTNQPGLVRRAVFSALPPGSKPAGVSTTRLGGFPTQSSSFGILSTGNVRRADDPNTSGSTGSQSLGPSIRGARDVVIMRVDLRVPQGDNCLSFDFRFLSEEFPEYVDDEFNDAFIAEVGGSDWSAATKEDPTIVAPRNFAQDAQGNPIRVNRVGDTTMTAGRARGTTFDGATRRLRASTRIQPGNRRLYLSIFDQGDRIFDSAVFLDKLRTSKASACITGVRIPS